MATIRLPPLKKYKALLFDLFHTLSSMYHSKIPGRDTHLILGLSKEEWSEAIFHKSDERLRGLITDQTEIIRSLALQIDPTISETLIIEAANEREKRFALSLKQVLPHTLTAISKLKASGYKIGLLSNADGPEVAGWKNSKLAPLFDAVIFSYEVGFVKPEVEIYQACLDKLSVTASDALFIGDGSNNEHAGAKALGMDTCCTSEFIKDIWPDKVDERLAKADYHISSITQLIS